MLILRGNGALRKGIGSRVSGRWGHRDGEICRDQIVREP
jgi:hypothetical protein